MEPWKEELLKILKLSVERASAIARRYYSAKPMSLDELLDHLEKVKITSIATVKPSGAPHIVPVSFVQLDGKIYINTSNKSVRYRNILHQKRVCLTFIDGSRVGILEGVAKIAGETSKFSAGPVDQAFIWKYKKARRDTSNSVMVEIMPTKIFTYKGAD